MRINVAQLVRQDAKGIWVVTGWEMLEPFEQVAPPSDADIAEVLDAFAQARIDGKGAEASSDFPEYDELAAERVARRSTASCLRQHRGRPEGDLELEVVDGPAWPEGRMQVELRLFAENGATLVEQVFSVGRDETGRLRLAYDFQPTTENGEAVPVEYAFLDGAVTYGAAYPLEPSQDGFRDRDRLAIEGLLPDDDAPRRALLFSSRTPDRSGRAAWKGRLPPMPRTGPEHGVRPRPRGHRSGGG